MKNIVVPLFVFALLSFSACTHIKVVAFDKRQNTVTIQGGKWATESDYQKAADEYCQGPATLLAMNTGFVGQAIRGGGSSTVRLRWATTWSPRPTF